MTFVYQTCDVAPQDQYYLTVCDKIKNSTDESELLEIDSEYLQYLTAGGYNFLYYAIYNNSNYKIVKFLIDQGVDYSFCVYEMSVFDLALNREPKNAILLYLLGAECKNKTIKDINQLFERIRIFRLTNSVDYTLKQFDNDLQIIADFLTT